MIDMTSAANSSIQSSWFVSTKRTGQGSSDGRENTRRSICYDPRGSAKSDALAVNGYDWLLHCCCFKHTVCLAVDLRRPEPNELLSGERLLGKFGA